MFPVASSTRWPAEHFQKGAAQHGSRRVCIAEVRVLAYADVGLARWFAGGELDLVQLIGHLVDTSLWT